MHIVAKYQDQNQKEQSAASGSVMCINLLVYIISICFYALMFSLSVMKGYKQNCAWALLSDFVFCLAQVTFFSRIAMSCYMNLRYSRPFDECKKQFVMLFSNSSQTRGFRNMSLIQEDQEDFVFTDSIEQVDRAQFDKRLIFYR